MALLTENGDTIVLETGDPFVSDSTIPALVSVGTLASIAYLPIVQDGVTVKVSVAEIREYLEGGATISGTLFVNENTFYAGAVSAEYEIAGSLYSNQQAFYGGTVTPGEITVTGTLFTNSSTFFGGAVSVGGVTITGSLFSNSSSFYPATVSQGSAPEQTIEGALFTNESAFYGGSVSASYEITGSRFDNASALYGGEISTSVTITGDRFDNQSTFYPATILVGGDQAITGSLFVNENVFYPGTITQPGQYQQQQPGGFLPVVLVDRHGKPVSLKKKANEVITKAKAVAKELPQEAKQDAKEAIRDLVSEISAYHVRELQRVLSGADQTLDRIISELARIAEEVEEEEIEILLMAA